ncbi:class F sortase [Yinghuangia sp. YIM S09857]|uniref:class F sortase n=1 Tax=Yinghuangia sp. YIM S09857 TaxID=3436929 RepID=UPI003F538C9C
MGRAKLTAVAAGAVILGVCVIGNDLKNEDGPPQPAAAQSAAPAPAAAPGSAPDSAADSAPETAPKAAPDAPGNPAAPQPAPPAAPAAPPPAEPMKHSPPLRIRIPAVKVDAPVIGVGLDAKGVLEVPPANNRNLTGWYEDGPAPGARGASVMLGHVDSKTGPAVFWSLGSLKQGDKITVDRADGKTAAFEVDVVESFRKDAFPDKRVYGQTPDAQLRLITCGGTYDKQRKDYLENVVVFAHLVPGS